jgi:hypothetical protein
MLINLGKDKKGIRAAMTRALYSDSRTSAPPPEPVAWIGRDASNRRRQCEVTAKTYFDARAKVRAELGVENVDVCLVMP